MPSHYDAQLQQLWLGYQRKTITRAELVMAAQGILGDATRAQSWVRRMEGSGGKARIDPRTALGALPDVRPPGGPDGALGQQVPRRVNLGSRAQGIGVPPPPASTPPGPVYLGSRSQGIGAPGAPPPASSPPGFPNLGSRAQGIGASLAVRPGGVNIPDITGVTEMERLQAERARLQAELDQIDPAAGGAVSLQYATTISRRISEIDKRLAQIAPPTDDVRPVPEEIIRSLNETIDAANVGPQIPQEPPRPLDALKEEIEAKLDRDEMLQKLLASVQEREPRRDYGQYIREAYDRPLSQFAQRGLEKQLPSAFARYLLSDPSGRQLTSGLSLEQLGGVEASGSLPGFAEALSQGTPFLEFLRQSDGGGRGDLRGSLGSLADLVGLSDLDFSSQYEGDLGRSAMRKLAQDENFFLPGTQMPMDLALSLQPALQSVAPFFRRYLMQGAQSLYDINRDQAGDIPFLLEAQRMGWFD